MNSLNIRNKNLVISAWDAINTEMSLNAEKVSRLIIGSGYNIVEVIFHNIFHSYLTFEIARLY